MLERFLQVVPSRMGCEGFAEESQSNSTEETPQEKKTPFHSVMLTAQAITALGGIEQKKWQFFRKRCSPSIFTETLHKRHVQMTEGN